MVVCGTVSYTHLDVYKRQTLTQMEEQIADFDTQLAAAREAAEAQVQEATNEADTSAVDVYKRQPLSEA